MGFFGGLRVVCGIVFIIGVCRISIRIFVFGGYGVLRV